MTTTAYRDMSLLSPALRGHRSPRQAASLPHSIVTPEPSGACVARLLDYPRNLLEQHAAMPLFHNLEPPLLLYVFLMETRTTAVKREVA